jgi:hypothetical protein
MVGDIFMFSTFLVSYSLYIRFRSRFGKGLVQTLKIYYLKPLLKPIRREYVLYKVACKMGCTFLVSYILYKVARKMGRCVVNVQHIGLDGYDGPVVISLGNNIRPCCLGPCFVGLLRAIRNFANIPHF